MHPYIHFVYEKKGRAYDLPCFQLPTHKGGKVFAQMFNISDRHWKTRKAQVWPNNRSPRLSQPHFEGNVKLSLTHPKMGLRSTLGFPKTQNTIARVKTPHIEVFLIPLERSWSVDVQNGLAWAIWTYATQVMVERRAGSQTGSLTPNH
jgi:hypothetical protein